MKIPPPNFDYYRALGFSYACLLFITGGLCVFTGFLTEDIYVDYSMFSPLNFLVMSSILSIAGNLILFAGILCLFVSFKKNKWLFIVIGFILGITISMELSASISGHTFNSNTPHYVERKMYESMKHYRGDNWKVARTWDKLQKTFQCCGTMNVTDWGSVQKSIPRSCCSLKREDALDPYKCGEYYADGCASIVSNLVIDRTAKASRVGIVSAIVQFTGLCAILFAHSLLQYLEKKERNDDTTYLKANFDIFTIDPYYSKLENEKKHGIQYE